MILQKKTINNVPTLVPLTADTGSGVPVGTIIGQYKKVNIPGYLYLDGSTFDQTLYPALYAYLGTNVLPDYREFVLVGAEQNTTSATIATHDVFTQGQEKDDQLQEHQHNGSIPANEYGVALGSSNYKGYSTYSGIGNVKNARVGTTTRTKEKAVFWYMKATTGIIESEATEILNLYNEQNSYSTSEINTGKTWVDGKPIYRKVVDCNALPSANTKTISIGVQDIDNVVILSGIAKQSSTGNCIPLPYPSTEGDDIQIWIDNLSTVYIKTIPTWASQYHGFITIEYTKTTD